MAINVLHITESVKPPILKKGFQSLRRVRIEFFYDNVAKVFGIYFAWKVRAVNTNFPLFLNVLMCLK
jgi:hypothetical protein